LLEATKIQEHKEKLMVTFPYIPGKVVVSGANGKNGFATMCELSKLPRVSELVGLFRKPQEKDRLQPMWRAHEEKHHKHIHATPQWTIDPQETRNAQIWIDFRGLNLSNLKKIYPNIEAEAEARGLHERDLLLFENLKISVADTRLTLQYAPQALRIQQGNPADVLVRCGVKIGYPAERIISTSTLLESDRLINIFNQTFPAIAIDQSSVLYIGDHGETAVPVKSRILINGVTPEEILKTAGIGDPKARMEEIYSQVLTEAFNIREKTGETPYQGPAAITAEVAEMILNPARDSVVSVSTYVEKNRYYDLEDIALSLPVFLGCEGVKGIHEVELAGNEWIALNRSIDHLEEMNRTADKLLAEL